MLSPLVLFVLLSNGAAAFTMAPALRLKPLPHRSPNVAMVERPSPLTYAAIGCGLGAQPFMWWSLFTLKTTGCGLPAGPLGLYGAAEGVSYLIVAGVVIASFAKKATTGKGFEAGPLGLVGLVEGLSILTALAGLAVLGFQLVDYGYIPNAVPIEGGVCS
jgi:hypothetical protein